MGHNNLGFLKGIRTRSSYLRVFDRRERKKTAIRLQCQSTLHSCPIFKGDRWPQAMLRAHAGQISHHCWAWICQPRYNLAITFSWMLPAKHQYIQLDVCLDHRVVERDLLEKQAPQKPPVCFNQCLLKSPKALIINICVYIYICTQSLKRGNTVSDQRKRQVPHQFQK